MDQCKYRQNIYFRMYDFRFVRLCVGSMEGTRHHSSTLGYHPLSHSSFLVWDLLSMYNSFYADTHLRFEFVGLF